VNLILLDAEDFLDAERAQISGRRLAHVREVLQAVPGDELRVGRIGGRVGTAKLSSLGAETAELEVRLDSAPPPPSGVTLIVALPRPPSLRKLLQAGTALGVKRFVLLQTARVEKSYWQSKTLRPDELRHQLLLGLEQARDTVLPEVLERRRFGAFVESELPTLAEGSTALFADPAAEEPCPRAVAGPVTLLVGPEGGWLDAELEQLRGAGLRGVGLGPRVLRVEHAVIALLARLG
jgi:RsmE family RNA methyltransferase